MGVLIGAASFVSLSGWSASEPPRPPAAVTVTPPLCLSWASGRRLGEPLLVGTARKLIFTHDVRWIAARRPFEE